MFNITTAVGGRDAVARRRRTKDVPNMVEGSRKYKNQRWARRSVHVRVRPCRMQQSFVHRGAAFEAAVSAALTRHGFRLRRCGGPHDGGFDLKVRT